MVRITEIVLTERKMRLTARGLYELSLFIPPIYRRLVIGRSGSVIQEIMRATQTYLQLDEDGTCLVQGQTQQNIQAAEQRLKVILATRIVTFALESRQVAMLMGKGGSRIKEIQASTGTQIDVNDRQVTVTAGSDIVLRNVLEKIRQAVSYAEATIQIPSYSIKRVIGTGGQIIQGIRSQTETWIDIAKDNSGKITIEGKARNNVDRAIQLIQSQGISVTTLSRSDGTLPSVSDARDVQAVQPKPKAKPEAAPVVTRQPAAPTPARPAPPPLAKTSPRPVQPTVFSSSVRVPVARLVKLTRKQGGFFSMLFGGGQTPVEKIQASTGTQIRIDSSTGVVTITGKSQDAVNRAVREITAAAQ